MVVHDAARPLVSPALFRATLDALAGADCAVAAAQVTDTVKEAGPDHRVTATLDRSRLWAIQTPQAFRRDALERALDVADDVLAAATDDAWLVERAGGQRGRRARRPRRTSRSRRRTTSRSPSCSCGSSVG